MAASATRQRAASCAAACLSGKVLVEGRGVYCLNIGGKQIDEAVTQAFIAALQPVRLAATVAAAEQLETDHNAALKQWRLGVELATYEAQEWIEIPVPEIVSDEIFSRSMAPYAGHRLWGVTEDLLSSVPGIGPQQARPRCVHAFVEPAPIGSEVCEQAQDAARDLNRSGGEENVERPMQRRPSRCRTAIPRSIRKPRIWFDECRSLTHQVRATVTAQACLRARLGLDKSDQFAWVAQLPRLQPRKKVASTVGTRGNVRPRGGWCRQLR
jgi:hypothetical protein